MILFCGDVHGEMKHIQNFCRNNKPDAIILLGDIQPKKPLYEILPDQTVYWIAGNHEDDNPDELANLMASPGNISGKVVEILSDGKIVRVAGIGGIFRDDIWHPPANPVYESIEQWKLEKRYSDPWFEKHTVRHSIGTIFPDSYLDAMGLKADILVSHDAPDCHPYGYDAINDLAREIGVSRVFHGDHHDCLDYSDDYDRMGFIAHGVGYRGITDEHGNKLIHGEYDFERMEMREEKRRHAKTMRP